MYPGTNQAPYALTTTDTVREEREEAKEEKEERKKRKNCVSTRMMVIEYNTGICVTTNKREEVHTHSLSTSLRSPSLLYLPTDGESIHITI